MSYSLNDKIISYLASKGVTDVKVHEGKITIGDFTRTINGVVSSAKLDVIVEEYEAESGSDDAA